MRPTRGELLGALALFLFLTTLVVVFTWVSIPPDWQLIPTESSPPGASGSPAH
jgi:hypothetical protein